MQHALNYWRSLVIFAAIVALVLSHFEAVSEWYGRVVTEDRYSHAPLVVGMVVYLIWLRKESIGRTNNGAWPGFWVVLLASLVLMAGELSAIWTLVQYGLVLTLVGLIWTLVGSRIRLIAVPLVLVFMTVPLPYMIDVMLSGKMQLLSSQLGVWILRLLGVSVFLEGNVIDLGTYRLQVVEACSGLNYMFPLMTIGLLFVYVYQAPLLARLLIFASTVPISVLMNSVRIAAIGILVNHQGIGAAEGFMHYFEGWVVFLLCLFLLLLAAKLINVLLRIDRPLLDTIDLYAVPTDVVIRPADDQFQWMPVALTAVLIATASVFSGISTHREEAALQRSSFSNFPFIMNGWIGRSYAFENDENSILGLSDYLRASYVRDKRNIGLYIGFADKQRKGFVPHSPQACIPGGGWEISDVRLQPIVLSDGRAFKVTRLLISKGDSKQVVYYWFRQRGRDLSSEYMMKLALLYDAIKINRTDGAIVRVTAPVISSVEEADKEVTSFISMIYPLLPDYIPD